MSIVDMWLLNLPGPRVVMITIVLVCHLAPIHQQDNYNNCIRAVLIILMRLEVGDGNMTGDVGMFRRLLQKSCTSLSLVSPSCEHVLDCQSRVGDTEPHNSAPFESVDSLGYYPSSASKAFTSCSGRMSTRKYDCFGTRYFKKGLRNVRKHPSSARPAEHA
jgi:hypothetical protein